MKFWNYKELNSDKLGNMAQVAGIRRCEFADGKAKGTEALEIRTGTGLEFTVLPGRGMDIAETKYRGMPLSYMSKTGVVSSEHYECGGMNWLHGFFAGALTTCGLLNVGSPEKVTHSVIGEREYGLHGRISNCPAEQVSVYEDWENGEYVMRASGMMSEAILHGEHLTLRREITTKFGSNEFKIKDTVTNRNAFPQDIMLLYHINFGYPLLDCKSRFVASPESIAPMSDEAKNDIDKVFECGEPVSGITERCYSHKLKGDGDGNVRVAFVNDELAVGVALEYNKNQLPCFNQWKMMNKKEYVVGLEPCTSLPIGCSEAKKRGLLVSLAPNETREYEITYKILDGNEAICEYEKSVIGER